MLVEHSRDDMCCEVVGNIRWADGLIHCLEKRTRALSALLQFGLLRADLFKSMSNVAIASVKLAKLWFFTKMERLNCPLWRNGLGQSGWLGVNNTYAIEILRC